MNRIFSLLAANVLLGVDRTSAFVTVAPVGSIVPPQPQRCSVVGGIDPRPTSTCLDAEPPTTPEDAADNTDSNKEDNDAGANDILNSPAFLKRKIDVLHSDIAKTEQDIADAKLRLDAGKAEWGGQLDELQKEYENIQSRLNDQSNQGGNMATVQVAREVLKVLDNFDRAFGVIKAETESQVAIEQEYRTTYNSIMSILSDLGVEEVETVGIEFDYEVHQAVMQKPSAEYDEGIVCEEFQKGFKLGDQLIRAAMVSVAA